MNDAKHFSIWLMPTGAVGEELAERIDRLSREFSSPLFPPHVTLIGGLNDDTETLRIRTARLAAELQPFPVRLGAIDDLDEFYRALFVRVNKTPSLLEANARARVLFRREDEPEYMPHLSLLYGDFSHAVKAQIIARLDSMLDVSFDATCLYLFSTLGQTRDWYSVGEFAL